MLRIKRNDVWRFLLTLEPVKFGKFEALLALHGRLVTKKQWLQQTMDLGATAGVAKYCYDNHSIISDATPLLENARQSYFDRIWFNIQPKHTKKIKQMYPPQVSAESSLGFVLV